MGIKVISEIRSGITSFIMVLLFLLICETAGAQDMLKEMRSNVIEKINGRDYYIHTIKKGQTLYMISKAYGADINEVIRENPEVKEGIRADQKIKIPVSGIEEVPKKPVKPALPKPKEKEIAVPSPQPEPSARNEITPVEVPAPYIALPCGENKEALKDQYHVALMMPLYLNESEKIDAVNPPSDPEEAYPSLRYLQFYEGFRIALDSLKNIDVPVHVHVYDAGKDTNNTRRILRNPELKKMDLIIGLLFHRNFLMVSAFAQKNNIPVVNPISERNDIISDNPMVFKAKPPIQAQLEELTSFLSDHYLNENIIIIRDVQFKDREYPENLARACAGRSMQTYIMDGYGKTFEVLSKEKENILVIFSESKVFAIELLTKLNEFRNDYRLTVLGMPDWDEMEGIETDYLVNLNTHVMTSSFIDYDDPEVKKFVMKFRQTYMTDPDPLAFQGFDITFYFFSALKKHGKAISHCIHEFRLKSLQNDFQFIRSKNNGFENRHWDIYKYENYRKVKVNPAN